MAAIIAYPIINLRTIPPFPLIKLAIKINDNPTTTATKAPFEDVKTTLTNVKRIDAPNNKYFFSSIKYTMAKETIKNKYAAAKLGSSNVPVALNVPANVNPKSIPLVYATTPTIIKRSKNRVLYAITHRNRFLPNTPI